MTLLDNATIAFGVGNYLVAPTGTAIPVNLLSPAAPWTNIGHTSLEDIFGISSEGGEATVLGTLQNKTLRTRYSARSETLNFTIMQFDEDSLKLYFGSNMVDVQDGWLGVPSDPSPTECAILIVFVDGESYFGFYAPKAEIYRRDELSVSDSESLAGLPLGIKPLQYQTNTWTYAVTPLAGTITATGATAGSPGTFTPSGAVPPADLATLQGAGITASPSTAWTTGQHVILGDTSHAHWDGDSWATGNAP